MIATIAPTEHRKRQVESPLPTITAAGAILMASVTYAGTADLTGP